MQNRFVGTKNGIMALDFSHLENAEDDDDNIHPAGIIVRLGERIPLRKAYSVSSTHAPLRGVIAIARCHRSSTHIHQMTRYTRYNNNKSNNNPISVSRPLSLSSQAFVLRQQGV